MEAAGQSSSHQQRISGGGGGGGGGGACVGDLPDALLSQIFSLTGNAKSAGASATLVSKRWHRVFHGRGSLWRHVDVSEPRDLDVCQREAWLAAKLCQLRRVAPAVESIYLSDTATMDVMLDVLQCLHPGVLCAVDAGEYGPALTESAMRALQRLAGLTRVPLGMGGSAPANCSWALSQLTSLQELWLEFAPFPADCAAAIAGPTGLRELHLLSSQPLPDVQPLTALSGLTCLILQEEGPSTGLLVLPAGQFPNIDFASYYSPVLMVGEARFTACSAGSGMVQLSGPPSSWQLSLSNLNLTAQGAVGQAAQVLKPPAQPLRGLDVRGCCLSSQAWHPGSEQLEAVTSLQCSGATAADSLETALNAGLQRMSSLCSISFGGCSLTSGIPTALRERPAITYLCLSGCSLTALPQLACMPVLEALILDYNSFTRLPSLGSAPRLQTLSLLGNPSLVFDAQAAARLPTEAPALTYLLVGGTAAAAVSLASRMPQLKML